MNIKMIRLSNSNPNNRYSDYENQLEPRLYFKSNEIRQIFEKNKDYLLSIVEKEILDYVHNDDLCNDTEGFFPKRSILTGEWYISSIFFEDDYLSVQTAFLGTDLGYKADYLGLEVVFNYNHEINEFSVDGVNSSAI